MSGQPPAGARLHGLPAVLAPGVRRVILGSFPSEASLAARQYYGHPTNQFWPLLSCVLVEPLVQLPYAERLRRLLQRGIGLWDVVAACEREGSLDASIREPRHNDLTLLQSLAPDLRSVVLNGRTAGRFAPVLAGQGYAVYVVPSSSAAHAGRSFDQKLELWRRALTAPIG